MHQWRFRALPDQRRWLERKKLTKGTAKWRIKKRESARTYRAFAMHQMEKSTAEKRAVTWEVKTWKARVIATISLVR
jgi:hypothetical protein